ncbi:Gas vesicle synthesis protein GvpO [Saccharopolyspora kobensis]|uniref:Gas vesicle synthesis protein GvpO n=1 Tax=Saccharopolyspora kobensis TaxID=146035 RepID=A0A1H6ACF8_9PSEU|nr:Gas vesicle synthesis protein GvpO [Saccharopolyspora kobensis]SFE54530.1 Gas vesicle synthesis protein GvpO [Saccharopolyspora kobensis]
MRDLTGKDTEGVTSLERSETGWLVAVEVVEAHRIPNTTDIMAVYEAELDDEGELISYRRIDRYARGQGEQR